MANGDGAAVGGPELNDAGIVIDLRGAEGATFDVLLDGDKRFVARGGHRAAITLRGYEDYSVAIRDRGTEFVQFDNTSRQVTLYPGNVETLTWELQRVMVILGKLVGPDGDPIGNATLEGTHDVVVSDPDGFFQGRIRGTDAELFARFGDERRCRLETGPIEPGSGVAQLGQVLCRPLDQSGAGSSDEARDRPVDQSGNNATPR